MYIFTLFKNYKMIEKHGSAMGIYGCEISLGPALATGFQSGASVAVIFVLVGLCLSFTLGLGSKKFSLQSDSRLANEEVSNNHK